MKAKFFLFGLFAMAITSCSTTYYQMYKVNSLEKLNNDGRFLIYEDQNCKVSYDLWKEGGNSGFLFYNKTDTTIYINLAESYFILNGIAHDYYLNRVITNNKTISVSKKASSGFNTNTYNNNVLFGSVFAVNHGVTGITEKSVAVVEKAVVAIPSKASKSISEYSINELRIKHCDLLKYPSKNQVSPLKFNEKESPLTFINKIQYRVGTETNPINFENKFYISQISNHPLNEFVSKERVNDCNHTKFENVFKYASADKFYIQYVKGNDTSKY